MIKGYFMVTVTDQGLKMNMEDGDSGFFTDRLMVLDILDQCSQYVRQLIRDEMKPKEEEKPEAPKDG